MADYIDARGSSLHNFSHKPKRIISVVPSQTELLYHLGLDEEVIGITKFCIHPDAWFRNKTRVGGTKTLHMDKIKTLQPDLIIANKEENTKEQVETLAREFPVWVTDITNLESALEMIDALGKLTDKTASATFLKAHIEKEFQQFKQLQVVNPLRVCYLIWKEPYLTVGGDTFINNMLQHAGFENIFSSEKRYPEITIKGLQKQRCDVLLLSSEPYPFAQKHISYFEALLPQTKIFLVDGELFSWYGSRLQWAPAYYNSLLQIL